MTLCPENKSRNNRATSFYGPLFANQKSYNGPSRRNDKSGRYETSEGKNGGKEPARFRIRERGEAGGKTNEFSSREGRIEKTFYNGESARMSATGKLALGRALRKWSLFTAAFYRFLLFAMRLCRAVGGLKPSKGNLRARTRCKELIVFAGNTLFTLLFACEVSRAGTLDTWESRFRFAFRVWRYFGIMALR